jgi:release factor glutamine methyltransferase
MSGTIGAAMRAGAARLATVGVPEPAGDARRLMAHALGIAAGQVTPRMTDPLPSDAAARFEAALGARAARQPVAQITGQRLFWGRGFRVTPDVLDPRPETETLVSAALEEPFAHVLDLGTGSGCILLSLLAERPAARGLGVDLSAAALAVARRNATELDLGGRAEFREGDWTEGIEGRFDLIVSNPPYISAAEMDALAPEVRDWEPHLALSPGGDGLDAYRRIASGAGRLLAPGGRLLLEIGPTQAPAVAAILAGSGFRTDAVRHDLDGRDRVILARKA